MKILVIHPGSLGDVILSLPALNALRQAYPMVRMDIIGNHSIFELLKGRYYVDSVISIDRADVSFCLAGQAGPAASLACRLREYAFVVNWLGDQAGELSYHLRHIGIKKIFSSRPVSQQSNDQHRTQIFLDTLAPLGIPVPLMVPRLFPTREDKNLGREALLEAGVSLNGQPILAIHPGSGGAFKCWESSRFVAVSRRAREHLGIRPLLILGPADQPLSQRLKNSLGEDLPILDCLPLPVLAGALTWCSSQTSGLAGGGLGNVCYLGNDAGTTHLAAALGIPTVAIFGPTDPNLWGPLGDRVKILSKRKEGGHRGEGVYHGCLCLDRITVEDVIQALGSIALDYSSVIC
jgi:ADP-heptose:LPS heptosyltransferase